MSLVLKGFGRGASLPIWGLGSSNHEAIIAVVAQPANVSLIAGTGPTLLLVVQAAPASLVVQARETFSADISVSALAATAIHVHETFRADVAVATAPATMAVQIWAGFKADVAVSGAPATAELASFNYGAVVAVSGAPSEMAALMREEFIADLAASAGAALVDVLATEDFRAVIDVRSQAAISLHAHETFIAAVSLQAAPASMGAHAHEVYEAAIAVATAAARASLEAYVFGADIDVTAAAAAAYIEAYDYLATVDVTGFAATMALDVIMDAVSPDPYVPSGSLNAPTSGPVVRIGNQDYTLDGLMRVAAVQFGGSMPGGHGSASFTVPVASAYLAPHHSLREGAWVRMDDVGAHELYEGEIFSIKPTVDTGGVSSLAVSCGGIISVAGKRADVSATWVHRGSEGWIRRPGTPSGLGSVNVDNGVIDLRVSVGSTQDYSAAALISSIWTVFYLDDGLGDDTITHVDLAGVYDVTDEGGNDWSWALYTAPSLGGTYTITDLKAHDAVSTNWSDDLTPPAGTKVLGLLLSSETGAHAVAAEKFVTVTTMDIFSRTVPDPAVARASWDERTTKPRIDEAMVDLAMRPGLATSFYSEPIGSLMDDLRVGNSKAKVTAAAGMTTLAAIQAQPFEYAFWDDRTFWCRPLPAVPPDSRVIVVGGGNGGLDSWGIAEEDEDVPTHALVLYGNKDDVTLPEGFPRSVYRPETPADDADLKVEVIDYSNLILSDASARALGDNLTARASAVLPAGPVFDALPTKAKGGSLVGNNLDPTTAYEETSDNIAIGTLTNYAYTAASGWGGSGSPVDPFCIVGDGTNDYVTFGDISACDFGTGAFSVGVWFKLGTLGVDNPLLTKNVGGTTRQGWTLAVSAANKLYAVVASNYDGASYRKQTGSTVFTVGVWHYGMMTYAGSGGDIALYVDGVAESLVSAGSAGAWNLSNSGDLKMMAVSA